jgi:RimJ/RimL family protein N-acetyltransferase
VALTPARIEVDELVLRPLAATDEPAIAQAMTNPDVLRWTAGSDVLRTPADKRALKWLASRIDGWSRNNAGFAIADAANDVMLGYVTLRDVYRVPDQATVAYWVSPAARGRRIAARALDAAARWSFLPRAERGLGLHRLSLDHALVNVGSCHVATRAGFQLEGVMRDYYVEIDGQRHDSHLHARLATDQLGTDQLGEAGS